MEIEIQTDLRVHDLIDLLKKKCAIQDIREIDSVNYGEGYDFTYEEFPLRLYDDNRSDLVRVDTEFVSGKISWNESFEKVLQTMKGKGLLRIEIDRHNQYLKSKREKISSDIESFLIAEGFRTSLK